MGVCCVVCRLYVRYVWCVVHMGVVWVVSVREVYTGGMSVLCGVCVIHVGGVQVCGVLVGGCACGGVVYRYVGCM